MENTNVPNRMHTLPWDVHGKPWMTLLRGRVLLNQGKLEQQLGYGQFLPAGSPLPSIGGRVQ